MHSYVLHVEQPCLSNLLSGGCLNITAMIRICVQMQSEVVQSCVLHIEQLCTYKLEFPPLHMSLCVVGTV